MVFATRCVAIHSGESSAHHLYNIGIERAERESDRSHLYVVVRYDFKIQ
jgi:hypothetical protein